MSRRLRATALAVAAATGLVPLAVATSADAAPTPQPKEHTKLPLCPIPAAVPQGASPQFYGVKAPVGFFHHVKAEGQGVNRVHPGQKVVLEYRVEDTVGNCVIAEPNVINVLVLHLPDRSTVSTLSATFETREKHNRVVWTVPDTPGEDYLIQVDALQAQFHVQ